MMVEALKPEQTDGHLPSARTRLGNAVSALTDPKPVTCEIHDDRGIVVDTRIRWRSSLYEQLVDAIPGSKMERSGVSRSQPPVWLDALDLLNEIDAAIAAAQPSPGVFDGDLTPEHPPTPETVRRLHLIEARPWRPQDVHYIDQITGNLEAWANSINALLTDERVKHIPAACPACGKHTVYRKDSAGELVRSPALQITTMGCQCQACRHSWGPELFQHLAKVLGCVSIPGVLE